jgi:hypothetical protein
MSSASALRPQICDVDQALTPADQVLAAVDTSRVCSLQPVIIAMMLLATSASTMIATNGSREMSAAKLSESWRPEFKSFGEVVLVAFWLVPSCRTIGATKQ